MIYTAIDTFYLSDDQLRDSPSRKDGVDEETETTLRIYGCDLIQESGILLKLPQAVMATGQVLFNRFYCKKSLARFDVKRVAASCVWLASKLEESPRKARQILIVFHRMECRRENLPLEHLDLYSKKYTDLKMDLIRTERHLLKEMGFICHVEHPHKFISNYLQVLDTPPELRQEAWNLANDSLRTTLCVRFKSEVVACGVVYASARRFQVPLPEDPPWWKAFDADKASIDEVCRVLAHLYSRPKAKYIAVCKDAVSFTSSNKSWDTPQPVPKDGSLSTPLPNNETGTPKTASSAPNTGPIGSKDTLIKQALDKLKESKKGEDDPKNVLSDGEGREDPGTRSKPEKKTEPSAERPKDRERDREREGREKERDKPKSRERDRRRDSDRERERDEIERDRERVKDRVHHSRDKAKDSGGHLDKSRHHSSRDRDRDYHSSYSSREKERGRYHPYS